MTASFYELIVRNTDIFDEDPIGGPVIIDVYAHFDDDTKKKLLNEVSLSSSNPSIGTIAIRDGTILFTPNNSLGSTTITANYKEASTQIMLEVIKDEIQFSPDALVLPIGIQFPILKSAIHYTFSKVNEPNYDIFEVVGYKSHDTAIADFLPKNDNIIFNSDRNSMYGHIHTFAPGKVDLSFSHMNTEKTIEIQVAPYRLLTTDKTEIEKTNNNFLVYRALDAAIDEKSDSFFLTGSTQKHMSLKLSHYSKEQGDWLPDLDISIPQPIVSNSNANFIVGEERVAIAWESLEASYLAIIDKYSKDYRVVEFPGTTAIKRLGIDDNNRIIACWADGDMANCKIENNGAGWSENQSLPLPIEGGYKKLQLTGENEFYSIALESSDVVSTIIRANKFKIIADKIEILSSNVIFESNELNQIDDICSQMAISNSGGLVCYFVEETTFHYHSLYTVSYSNVYGWDVLKHMEESPSHSFLSATRHARVGINDNGGIMLMWPDSTQGEVVTKEYEPGLGWAEKVTYKKRIGSATPFLTHAPKYTDEGWKTFLSYADAIVVKSEGAWQESTVVGYRPHDNPFSKREYLGAPHSYGDVVAIDQNGGVAIAWVSAWGARMLDGIVVNNSLYFASPSL